MTNSDHKLKVPRSNAGRLALAQKTATQSLSTILSRIRQGKQVRGSETALHPMLTNYVNQLRLRLDRSGTLSVIHEVICRYMRNPRTGTGFYSFKGYEYAIDIIDDPSARKCVRKCSQVGMTETVIHVVAIRGVIGRNDKIIYALPTKEFAEEVSSTRFIPKIQASPNVSSLVRKDLKNNSVFGIGTCQIYFRGTYGAKGAISVDAQGLVVDEKDFCNPVVLGKMSSRLNGNKPNEHGQKGWRYDFSTPTAEGYGIDADFEQSDQRFYRVKCPCCEKTKRGKEDPLFAWKKLDFFRDCVLPGWPKDKKDGLKSLRREHLLSGSFDITGAYLSCPDCGMNLDNYLGDPERRRWFAENPQSVIAGWHVDPWCVPSVNTCVSLLTTLKQEEDLEYADWVNFYLGLPYSDDSNSFSPLPFLQNTCPRVKKENIDKNLVYFIGVDVGKRSHLVVFGVEPNYLRQGKSLDPSREHEDQPTQESVVGTDFMHIIKEGKGRVVNYFDFTSGNDAESLLAKFVAQVVVAYNAAVCVIDGEPDFTTTQLTITLLSSHHCTVYAADYTENKIPGNAEHFQCNEDKSTVTAYRTGIIDTVRKAHNAGLISYCDNAETTDEIKLKQEFKQHLSNVFKASEKKKDGTVVTRFLKKGADHFVHALVFAYIAYRCKPKHQLSGMVSAIRNISTFTLQKPESVAPGDTEGSASTLSLAQRMLHSAQTAQTSVLGVTVKNNTSAGGLQRSTMLHHFLGKKR